MSSEISPEKWRAIAQLMGGIRDMWFMHSREAMLEFYELHGLEYMNRPVLGHYLLEHWDAEQIMAALDDPRFADQDLRAQYSY